MSIFSVKVPTGTPSRMTIFPKDSEYGTKKDYQRKVAVDKDSELGQLLMVEIGECVNEFKDDPDLPSSPAGNIAS